MRRLMHSQVVLLAVRRSLSTPSGAEALPITSSLLGREDCTQQLGCLYRLDFFNYGRRYLLCAETPVIACSSAVRAAAKVCGSASSGRPVPYGGWGAYSRSSSTTRPMLLPAHRPAIAMPKSMPAVTPPPVSDCGRRRHVRCWARRQIERAFPVHPSAPPHGSLATGRRPRAAASPCTHCTPSGPAIRDRLERRLRRNRLADPMSASHRHRQRERPDPVPTENSVLAAFNDVAAEWRSCRHDVEGGRYKRLRAPATNTRCDHSLTVPELSQNP